jgi:hypothetical protein
MDNVNSKLKISMLYNHYNIMKNYVSLGAALMLGTVLARGRKD